MPSAEEYVTLVSGDGFEFVIPRSTACVSGTIRRMLEPSSKSSSLISTKAKRLCYVLDLLFRLLTTWL